jgi:hypothetical protein
VRNFVLARFAAFIGVAALALTGCGGKIATTAADGDAATPWWCSEEHGTVTYDSPRDPYDHIAKCPDGAICGLEGTAPGHVCCIENGRGCYRADGP